MMETQQVNRCNDNKKERHRQNKLIKVQRKKERKKERQVLAFIKILKPDKQIVGDRERKQVGMEKMPRNVIVCLRQRYREKKIQRLAQWV